MDIETLYVILAIVGLIFWIMISTEFAQIADSKGHSSRKYFAYTFFFGVIGMLMVIALPDTYARPIKQKSHFPAAAPKPAETPAEPVAPVAPAEPAEPVVPEEPKNSNTPGSSMEVSYRCGKCGYLGPYGQKCPACSSTIKFYTKHTK